MARDSKIVFKDLADESTRTIFLVAEGNTRKLTLNIQSNTMHQDLSSTILNALTIEITEDE